MGTDISLYREKLVGGKWVTADEWTDEGGYRHVPWGKRAYTGRAYDLFGILSKGVRGYEFDYSFEPRGLPDDLSEEVRNQLHDDGGYGESYLTISELRALRKRLDSEKIRIVGMKDAAQLAELRASIASGEPDWSLLYPYCGGTTRADYEQFEVDVPAAWCVGGKLDIIIDSFDGMDGDDHRIVFNFDC